MSRFVRSLVLVVFFAAVVMAPLPARPQVSVQPQSGNISQLPSSTQISEIFNVQTGQITTMTPGPPPPAGWEFMQSPPPVAPAGSSVSFLPGQTPELYANPASGQSQWVLPSAQPPAGWIELNLDFPAVPAPPSSLTAPPASSTTPGATTPTTPPQFQTTKQPSSDYGAGGHSEQDTNSANGVLEGRVYDPNNNLRDDTTYQYTNYNGKQYKTGSYLWDFNPKGRLSFTLGLRYDLRGDLASSDLTNYGLHGERTSEEITNYHSTGYEIRDWKIGTHGWSMQFNTYKLPTTTGATTLPQTPITPGNTSIGILFPRDYHPGDTITGSLWPSSYADNFKTVPGLSEYDFPLQSYSLPDGAPEWSRIKIGVTGNGYFPVRANGTFSFHIPLSWKGPLTLQALESDPTPNLGASSATLQIGDPVAAPTLPSNYFPAPAQAKLNLRTKYHLLDLWDEADYMEYWLDDEYAATNPDWYTIWDMEDYLDDLYDEIDDFESAISPAELEALYNPLHLQATSFNDWFKTQPNLTAGDQTELKYSAHWANFLSRENDNASWLSTWNSPTSFQPFWTNPVLNGGKLNVMRGSFFGDPFDTHIRIGNSRITPIGATPREWYFMPRPGLSFGQGNYTIESPLFPETTLPFFDMALTMGAKDLSLHKGQKTTYWARLSIFNGSSPLFPSLFDGPPLYETDIIGSSELSAAQQAAPTSRTGFITFSVTSESATIAMQNQYRVLNASGFVPLGYNEIDGDITGTADGGYSVLGQGRAELASIGGLGTIPGSSAPSQGYSRTNWLPAFNISYNPTALTSSPLMTSCPGSSLKQSYSDASESGGAFSSRAVELKTPAGTEKSVSTDSAGTVEHPEGSVAQASEDANGQAVDATKPAASSAAPPTPAATPSTQSSTPTVSPAAAATPGATTPTAPATTPTTPAPAVTPAIATPGTTTPAATTATTPIAISATAASDSSASDCPDPSIVDLYNDAAGGSSSVPVGNPPSAADMNAAKKRLQDAEDKTDRAEGNLDTADKAVKDAWNQGFANLSQDLQDYYNITLKQQTDADLKLYGARQAYQSHPTKANLDDLVDAQWDADNAKKITESTKKFIEGKFKPADEARLKAARDAREKALQDLHAAQAQEEDAANALNQLQPPPVTK